MVIHFSKFDYGSKCNLNLIIHTNPIIIKIIFFLSFQGHIYIYDIVYSNHVTDLQAYNYRVYILHIARKKVNAQLKSISRKIDFRQLSKKLSAP